jgi:hypothetical protein
MDAKINARTSASGASGAGQRLRYRLAKPCRPGNPFRQQPRRFQKLPQQAKNLLDTIRIYVMSVNPVIGEEKMSELATEFWPVKPEPGSVADQLIKKGEARGKVIGEAIGEAREKTNTIRILQSILNVPQSTDQELAGKTSGELQAMIDALQQQIVQRPS